VRRSLVRVKIWCLLIAFFLCAGILKFAHLSQAAENVVLGVAVVAPILLYAVRCERCKTRELTFGFGGPSKSFGELLVPPDKCPKCGFERI
jgi:hypothetical protein